MAGWPEMYGLADSWESDPRSTLPDPIQRKTPYFLKNSPGLKLNMVLN